MERVLVGTSSVLVYFPPLQSSGPLGAEHPPTQLPGSKIAQPRMPQHRRLYDYPAPDASESAIRFRSDRGDDASQRYLGNSDAGSRRGNPDIRVPGRPEKDDGLDARGAKEMRKKGTRRRKT
ncbi:hypothetical protein NDU88_001162 [Pleurodeles waltl]|uniref:Uncharacterized protein n=1 Tax=Pleurodeles waltl TaxID=8319 RepID=A0AAV7U5L0_PLEWA|nr:hypothetical protein NDU88_001162 [Pleurodeles waltl]